MYQWQYRWVWTPWGYQLQLVQVYVPIFYYAPVYYYYW